MQKAVGLTKLLGLLQSTDAAAGGLAERLEKAHANLRLQMTTTMTIVDTVEKTAGQLKVVNQAMLGGDNGGPAGPLPSSLPGHENDTLGPAIVPPWQPMDNAPRDGTVIMLRLPGVADDGALGRWGGSQWIAGATNDAVFPSMWKAK